MYATVRLFSSPAVGASRDMQYGWGRPVTQVAAHLTHIPVGHVGAHLSHIPVGVGGAHLSHIPVGDVGVGKVTYDAWEKARGHGMPENIWN